MTYEKFEMTLEVWNRYLFWHENLASTLVILCSKIKIQWIAPGVKESLIQAEFLRKFCHFQNSLFLPRVQVSRLRDEYWKTLCMGHCFLSIFDNLKKNNGQAFSGCFAQRLYKGYNQFQCSRPVHVGKSWPSAHLQVIQNSVSLMLMLRVKPY